MNCLDLPPIPAIVVFRFWVHSTQSPNQRNSPKITLCDFPLEYLFDDDSIVNFHYACFISAGSLSGVKETKGVFTVNVEEIIGMPIVSARNGQKLGKVTNIVMDQNLKHVKRIQLSQNRFVVLDDIVECTKSAVLVKNAQAVQKSPIHKRPEKPQSNFNKTPDIPSMESRGHTWWAQITNWD